MKTLNFQQTQETSLLKTLVMMSKMTRNIILPKMTLTKVTLTKMILAKRIMTKRMNTKRMITKRIMKIRMIPKMKKVTKTHGQ